MFEQTVLNKAKEDAITNYPNESCGLIVKGSYLACTNIADTPDKDFRIDDSITSKYIIEGTLEAVIHSHPHKIIEKKSCPSSQDMIGQINTNVPWGIVDTDGEVVNNPYWFGDFILDEDILGKEFHAGVNDCYTLIRKWYWQNKGVKIKEFPRDDAWWATEDDLYLNGFSDAGFVRISREELRDGDVMLGRVMSDKVNHGGIYLHNKIDGFGVLLHHLPNRLSRRETANPWLDRAQLFLRYIGNVT